MSYILIRYTGKARLYGLFSLGVWRCLKYLNLYSPRFFYAVKITLTSGGGYKGIKIDEEANLFLATFCVGGNVVRVFL